MKVEGDYLIFSSGKKVYANCGIVGMGPNLSEPTGGYDHSLTYEDELSPDEIRELSDFMVALWQQYGASADGQTAE